MAKKETVVNQEQHKKMNRSQHQARKQTLWEGNDGGWYQTKENPNIPSSVIIYMTG